MLLWINKFFWNAYLSFTVQTLFRHKSGNMDNRHTMKYTKKHLKGVISQTWCTEKGAWQNVNATKFNYIHLFLKRQISPRVTEQLVYMVIKLKVISKAKQRFSSFSNFFHCKSSRAEKYKINLCYLSVIFLHFQPRANMWLAVRLLMTEVAFILTQFLLGLDHSRHTISVLGKVLRK